MNSVKDAIGIIASFVFINSKLPHYCINTY